MSDWVMSEMRYDETQLSDGVMTLVEPHHHRWIRWTRSHDVQYIEAEQWSTIEADPDLLLEFGPVHFEYRAGRAQSVDVMFEANDCFCFVELDRGSGRIRVNVGTLQANKSQVRVLIEHLRETFPQPEPTEAIPVTFWFAGEHGPNRHTRMLKTPSWDEIRENYSARTLRDLDSFMDQAYHPGDGGRLFLWQGEPGTGKTWGLRALTHAWRAWCDVEYITDPEAFLGDASYLMNVLMTDDYRSGKDQNRWRLLILEDTGELLTKDAKAREGQRLSRLLNTVDGFIGQALNVLLLVTTNEELGALHPAVSRPGRCGSLLEFTALSPHETAIWMEKRGRQDLDVGSATLAQLFGLLNGGDTPSRPSIGFL